VSERRRVIRTPRGGSVEPLGAQNGSGAPPVPESTVKPGEGRQRTVDLGLFDRRKSVVVGIDQSLVAFGLVAYSYEDDTAFAWLYEPSDFGVRRLLYIRFFVHRVIQQVTLRCGKPEHVAMEGYSYGSQAGREKLGECGAAVKMALIQALGIVNQAAYPSMVAPQQVKKFTTSNGNAKKNQMLLAIYKKWGVTFTDDNLADAYALARVAAALATGETKFDYEADVIRRIARNTEWELLSKTARSTSSTKARKQSSG
jgi:Holliday junction resolvasome RuvABC endonuclease subunit